MYDTKKLITLFICNKINPKILPIQKTFTNQHVTGIL